MSKRILFDKKELLGDTVKSDFNGIDYLNCFEYSFWQLLRQNGIDGYEAVMGTNCFLSEPNHLTDLYNLNTIQKNLEKLVENTRKLYNIHKNICKVRTNEEIYHFILSAIGSNKFIYLLYDNRYDTLNKRSPVDYLHSTVITGYDDEREQYIPIEDEYYNIKYSDYFNMYCGFQKDEFWKEWTLFTISEADKKLQAVYTSDEIAAEVNKVLKDWEEEIRCMENILNQLDYGLLKDENYIYKMRINFYLLGVGVHGNLYFKARLFEKYMGVSFGDFYNRYENNRKACQLVAAKLGRLAVEFKNGLLDQILGIIYEKYVKESNILRNEFLSLVSEKDVWNDITVN